MSGPIVTIGGVRFYGDSYRGKGVPHIGPNESDFDGFLDSLRAEYDDAKRPTMGLYDADPYYPARYPHMAGFVSADTHTELEALRRHIVGLHQPGKRSVMVELGRDWFTLTAEVVSVTWDQASFAPEAVWSVDLRCVDPLKRGELRTYTAPATVFHRGRFDALPTVTVRATTAMSGYTINGPDGKKFIVTSPLPAGQTDTIDFATGWVYRGGALLEKATSRSETWPVPPGTGVAMSLTPTTGSGVLTVKVHDTDL